jgi:hypothetical protein
MKMKFIALIGLSLTLSATAMAGPSAQSLMKKRLQQGQDSQAATIASTRSSSKSFTQRGPKKLRLALSATNGNSLAGSPTDGSNKIQRHGPRHW